MREILPGVVHWTTHHERIGAPVSSYWLPGERVLIDPRVPAEGLEPFAGDGAPVAVLLTNRHHYRHAGRFAERFGATVHVNRAGLHDFGPDRPVEPFDPGDELPGGVLAVGIGAICPDESALLLRAHAAVALADGLIRHPPDGPLGFVPDSLMDDPERTRRGLVAAYRDLLGMDWDTLLLAHGDPIVGTGRAAMEEAIGR
jgi:hypothetical protein